MASCASDRLVAACSSIDAAASGLERLRLLLHARLDCLRRVQPFPLRVIPNVLRDPHAAELRPAHGAEMRALGAFRRERLVVVAHRPLGIERQMELVAPAEFESGLGQSIVALSRLRMALGEIGGVGGDLVRNDAFLHILPVRQPQMLLGRHITEHRRAEPADHRRPDRACDMVVARRNVRRERTKRVEGSLVADRELTVHIFLDQMHRNMARTFDHDLHVMLPGNLGQLAERVQLRELRLVVGVRDRSRPQPVAEREGHVVSFHDFADIFEMRVQEVLPMVGEAPGRHDGASPADDARNALRSQRHITEQHSGMDGEIIDSLLGLLDQRIAEHLPAEVLRFAVHLLQRLIDRHGPDRNRGVADDPFPRRMDVLAGGQIHDRIGSPAGRPRHLLHLLLDRGGHGGVADVGVDLHVEMPPDDHRLALGMVDVGRNDRSSRRDLGTYELRLHPFPQGDELHLGSHDALPCVMQLGDVAPCESSQRQPAGWRENFRSPLGGFACVGEAIVLGTDDAALVWLRICPLRDPASSHGRQASRGIRLVIGVGIRAACVIDSQRLIGDGNSPHLAVRQRDFPHRNHDILPASLHVDFAAARQQLGMYGHG
ncbi:Putative uncharacterized protein [Paenibacillus sp. P22]|nr:Putative uncharacterized protein [Paenibacillus sp. P22]